MIVRYLGGSTRKVRAPKNFQSIYEANPGFVVVSNGRILAPEDSAKGVKEVLLVPQGKQG